MRFIFAISLFALIGCAGNKPAAEKSVDFCNKIANLPETDRELITMPNAFIQSFDGKCESHETITCNGIDYGIFYKCPDGNVIPVFND